MAANGFIFCSCFQFVRNGSGNNLEINKHDVMAHPIMHTILYGMHCTNNTQVLRRFSLNTEMRTFAS